ncbi:MAG: ATP-binding cassette domain-containing protein [Clostridia bacterium]|nr:ATP-binding cassette domain-containing protein [Clostridia bacterium]
MDTVRNTVLEVEGLCKSYGDKNILKNVSFSVEAGEVVGFLGPNGAGKSTTMNIITGYLSPTRGKVTVCGTDTLEAPRTAKSKIGYLPELPPLYFDMTVYEYLSFVFDLKKCELDKKRHIAECMALVKITDVAHRIIKNLSKGYKQRVGVAQALIGDPDILILDEPTVGLDPAQIMEIRDVIRYIGKTKTIILSTHILQEVTAVCDKVIIINRGRIMACDSLKNLESGSFDTYTLKVPAASAGVAEAVRGCGVDIKPAASDEMGVHSYVLSCAKGEDVREKLFNAFVDAGIPMLEFAKTTKSIEDVFRQYTSDSVDIGVTGKKEREADK